MNQLYRIYNIIVLNFIPNYSPKRTRDYIIQVENNYIDTFIINTAKANK